MLKETETEETIVFFVAFLSLAAIQSGGTGPLGSTLLPPRLRLWFLKAQDDKVVFTFDHE